MVWSSMLMGYFFKDKLFFQGEEMQPIPLTEEWLSKFGFIKEVIIEDGITYNHYYNGNPIELYGYDAQIYFDKGWDTELKYVHQLQNLNFALTGNELNIKP